MEDADAKSRFQREIKTLGRLNHPNLVQAHDAREIQGTTILVMEYVDGLDASALARNRGALP
jgi:serine/threonine protein kinase